MSDGNPYIPDHNSIFCQAIFDRLNTSMIFRAISIKNAVSETRIKVDYKTWKEASAGSQPLKATDIRLSTRTVGRPTVLTTEEKDLDLRTC